MHSRVDLVADLRGGVTVLTRTGAEGGLALRRTGPGAVHLVGTAAGPLGGDLIEIGVRVRAGARLAVHGVAATLALPGADGARALWSLHAEVDAGGRLEWAPQPLVVCAGAWLETRTTVDLHPDAELDLTEQVVLGRHGEDGGRWRGRLAVDRGGTAVLRATQTSTALAAGAARALASRLLSGPDGAAGDRTGSRLPQAGTLGRAVACRLAAGGLLLTAHGPDLRSAVAELDELVGSPARRETASR